jgi:hypothetical protein
MNGANGNGWAFAQPFYFCAPVERRAPLKDVKKPMRITPHRHHAFSQSAGRNKQPFNASM